MLPELAVYAFVQKQILPLEEAYLHVSDLAIQRGYGVFDYFRTHKGRPLFLDHYLNRFYGSALMMGLRVPLAEGKLKSTLEALMEKNAMPDSGIKMILTGGYSPNGYDLAKPNLVITQEPLPLPSPQQQNQGLKLITHEYVRELPRAKTINYSMGIRLLQQIKAQGADDVIYHHHGVVTECPCSNLFIVTQDNTLVTPAKNVLMGVTRKNILTLAHHHFKTRETVVKVQDLLLAKEVFTTSTTKGVQPVVQVNGQRIGSGETGEVTRQLAQELQALEEEQVEA